MGVDVVWFMPIHPIGQRHKKGSLGCPYSIVDYREVNPDYGTREDFQRLIKTAHGLGLQVMIDVVFNHTAHDSHLVAEHLDWYHQDATGQAVTTVPEWSDVIDLKQPNSELADYLVETLCYWADFGVDGFRCDVAPLLPLDFWLRAREAVAKVKPGVIWLAESVHADWVAQRRRAGLPTLSDGELYRAFDLTYDYDIWPLWQAAVVGEVPVADYLEMLRFQDCIYPAGFIKMRCVENHDQPRIMALAPTESQALAWTAFQAVNKGAFLIYAGQESGATHTPSLFDIDKIAWDNFRLQPFLTRLTELKKDQAQQTGEFTIIGADPVITALWHAGDHGLFGAFNVSGAEGAVPVFLGDGVYHDLLSGDAVKVRAGHLQVPAVAAIVRWEEHTDPRAVEALSPLHSILLDFEPDVDAGVGP
jgi:glycosidase